VCRFCQHSFVEEEAEQARIEVEQASARSLQQAEFAAQQAAEFAAQQAAEAAKPWLQRNVVSLFVLSLIAATAGLTWYGMRYPTQNALAPATNSAPENKPPMPARIAEERSRVPKSVWDKRVAWATQHHCHFTSMSRDEIVRAWANRQARTRLTWSTSVKPTSACATVGKYARSIRPMNESFSLKTAIRTTN
jgi:hypothetical protein